MERKVGDLVLVYVEETPSFYGRIEKIEPDIKPGWYQVTFLFLGIPARTVVWILREEYIDGAPFTMGGNPLRIELVPPLQEVEAHEQQPHRAVQQSKSESQEKDQRAPNPKVIPFKPKR